MVSAGVDRRSAVVGEQLLDRVRREVGMGRQQQRGRRRHHGSRLRGATAEEQRLVDEAFRVIGIGGAARSPQAPDVGAGRGEIGVAHAVAAARPIGDRVTGLGRLDTTDGDQASDRSPASSDRPHPAPSLPAAVTTTMPACHARSSGGASGSVSDERVEAAVEGEGQDVDVELRRRWRRPNRRRRPLCWRRPTPSRPATLTDTIPASGATPRKLGMGDDVDGSAPGSRRR